MNCNNRIFVLHEKDKDRYVKAVNKEKTARAIVKQRIEDNYWYDESTLKHLNVLFNTAEDKKLIYKWLLSNNSEYEMVSEEYLEELE